MKTSQLIAHRGWQNRYPENSLLAITAALEAGAQHIEIDIQLTSDGHIVLCHDRELDRLTGNSGLTHQCTLAELQALSFHEPSRLGDQFKGNPICTLDDCIVLLNDYPEAKLYIEIKRNTLREFSREQLLAALLPLVQAQQSQIILISFDYEVLQLAKQRGNGLSIAPVALQWSDCCDNTFTKLSPPIVFCNIERIPADVDLATLTWPLAVYEIDTVTKARHWLLRGATMVETFCIGELIKPI